MCKESLISMVIETFDRFRGGKRSRPHKGYEEYACTQKEEEEPCVIANGGKAIVIFCFTQKIHFLRHYYDTNGFKHSTVDGSG